MIILHNEKKKKKPTAISWPLPPTSLVWLSMSGADAIARILHQWTLPKALLQYPCSNNCNIINMRQQLQMSAAFYCSKWMASDLAKSGFLTHRRTNTHLLPKKKKKKKKFVQQREAAEAPFSLLYLGTLESWTNFEDWTNEAASNQFNW